MKNIITLIITSLLLFNSSFVSAQVGGDITRSISKHTNTYSTAESFLKSEGNLCTTATDGINVMTVENGEFGISTLAFTLNPKYSCTNYKLSNNDMNLYNSLKSKADSKYIEKLKNVITQYEKRMKMLRWSDEKRIEIHEKLIKQLEIMISDLFMKYPQDITLNEEDNDKYLKYTLLKFELILLDM